MACCSEFQTECLRVVTIGYLKSFIGNNLQDSSGRAMSVTHPNGDEYCPTYSELVGGSLVQNWQQGTTPNGDRDGIVVGGSYANDQLVRQEDLSFKYTRFKTFTIDHTGSSVSACGGNVNISYVHTYTRSTKDMNSSCEVNTTSSDVGDTQNSEVTLTANCNWVHPQVGRSTVDAQPQTRTAATRSCTVTGKVTFRTTDHTDTTTVRQAALSGSYIVYVDEWCNNITVHANSPTSFGCNGGTYSAYADGEYTERYAWKDSCDHIYYESPYDDRRYSYTTSTQSGTFSDKSAGGGSDSATLYFSYLDCSDSITFTQTCQAPPPCESETVYGTGTGSANAICSATTVTVTSTNIPYTSYTRHLDDENNCITETSTGSISGSVTVDVPCNDTSGQLTITGTKAAAHGNISYTITQAAGPCCPFDCECKDMTVSPTSLEWPASATSDSAQTITLDPATCVKNISISSPTNFNATLNGRTSITVTPKNANTSTTALTDTLTISYDAVGSDVTNHCYSAVTLTQLAPECNCGNFSITPVTANWVYDSTAISSITISSGACISNITLSSLSHFSASVDSGIIQVKPRENNTGETTIAETLTVNYYANGSPCDTPKTVTLTHTPRTCDCDSLTIDTTPSAWNWDSTVQKTATYSFRSSCIDSSSISVTVTGSSANKFTVTNAVSTNSGTITISPTGTNTSTTTVYTATVVINYTSNGETCEKTFLITQKIDACSCEDLEITPITSVIANSATTVSIRIADMSNTRGCFDTFNTTVTSSDGTNWLTVKPISKTDTLIGADVLANPNCTRRTATITINYGSGGTTSTCTTSFTLTQEARECTCSDVTFNVTKTSLDCGGATNQQIGTYSLACPNCSRSLLSKGGTFNQLTITFEDGKILATYPAAVGTKSGTLILKYNGNTCTTVSMSQRECCDCSNLTLTPTAATWEYDVTTPSSITVSSGICITDISLSTLTHFTASIGANVITVSPRSNNTGTSDIVETLTVSYKANGTTCTPPKTITLTHKPKACDCNDLTITVL